MGRNERWAGRSIAIFVASTTVDCVTYTNEVTARIVDPRLVTVHKPEIKAREQIGYGGSTLRYESDDVQSAGGGGTLIIRGTVGREVVVADPDEFHARFTDYAKGPWSRVIAPQSGTVSTPWTNVLEVRENRTANHTDGVLLLIAGTLVAVLGTYVTLDAIEDPNGKAFGARVIGGPLLFVGGATLVVLGVSNLLAPSFERVFFTRTH